MTTKQDVGPATPDESEALAINAVRQYLSDCRLTEHDQMGNHLMKLCSVAALFIWSREGPEIAALRLEGAAEFIRQRMGAKSAHMEKLQ